MTTLFQEQVTAANDALGIIDGAIDALRKYRDSATAEIAQYLRVVVITFSPR